MITSWLIDLGTSYDVDALLYEVETEKNTVEIVAKLPGTILRVIAPSDCELSVGALLAVVADPGEYPDDSEIDALVGADLAEIAKIEKLDEAAPDPSPMAAMDTTGLLPVGADRGMRVIPKARAMAAAAGLELSTVIGTGNGGSITVADVEVALASDLGGSAVAERRPLSSVARGMANVLSASWRDVPQFVQQIHADATHMKQIRAALAGQGVRVTFTDILIAAVAATAREVPEANAQFNPDAIHIMADVNVTVAVDTDAGLLVPVIARADQLDVAGVSVRLQQLSERARARRLTAADTAGGTITVSNLGAAGIETGVPLVVSPQATVVFAGAITDCAVVVDGVVGIRPLMGLAIGYDHRVLDGSTAARFTSALKRRLETGA
ncbi:MAG: 2-oxo acid dehydrogenase subunit E2 [Flavobacterium sp.]|nr:2-oxo acid dehydrogenase subunit E2 [Aeromicrobium sp.]